MVGAVRAAAHTVELQAELREHYWQAIFGADAASEGGGVDTAALAEHLPRLSVLAPIADIWIE